MNYFNLPTSARYVSSMRCGSAAATVFVSHSAQRVVREPQPLFHATLAMRVSGAPAGWTARVVFLLRKDGVVEPFVRLLEYMRAHPFRSSTWQNTVARGVGLFWDYCQAHGDRVMREAAVTKTHPQEALFRGFALALLSGTDMSNADDELLWPSTSIHRSRELISAVEAFAEWSDTSAARTAILPAKLKQAPSDQLNVTDMLIWARMRNVSMLRHIKAPNIVRRTNIIDFGPDTRGHGSEPVKFFPPDHVERLLWEGHVRPGMEHEPNPFLRFNVRDQMIALLDAWGGLRRSDGLHLWVNDVVEEPKKPGHALVVLNHPSEAKVEWFDPIARRTVKLTRAEVLRRQYDLLPRNQVTRGRYHVGWKNLELNREHQAFVYWLEQSAGDLFWVLYLGYLRHVRAPIMQRRKALGGYDHPFLFVSLGGSNTDGGMIGDPLSSQAYTDSHERAVLRLGLEHSKEAGTSTHGLRHLYGQTLANLGVSAAIIKKGMHHRHLLSQVPYTVPTADRVNSVLRAAVSGQPLEQQPLGHESALALRDLHQFIVGGTPRV